MPRDITPVGSALRDRFEHQSGIYRYHQGDVFTPGAGNYVFEPAFSLVPYALIGSATQCGNSPAALQTPQVWVNLAVPVVGVGGLIAGQFAMQGLLAPDDPNQFNDEPA